MALFLSPEVEYQHLILWTLVYVGSQTMPGKGGNDDPRKNSIH
jgi:hypothetical protein